MLKLKYFPLKTMLFLFKYYQDDFCLDVKHIENATEMCVSTIFKPSLQKLGVCSGNCQACSQLLYIHGKILLAVAYVLPYLILQFNIRLEAMRPIQ